MESWRLLAVAKRRALTGRVVRRAKRPRDTQSVSQYTSRSLWHAECTLPSQDKPSRRATRCYGRAASASHSRSVPCSLCCLSHHNCIQKDSGLMVLCPESLLALLCRKWLCYSLTGTLETSRISYIFQMERPSETGECSGL